MTEKTPVTRSLFQTHPKEYFIPVGLLASAILLVLGIFLPIITLKEMILFKSTFSVWTGIIGLIKEHHYGLGIIIFLFSIIFPITKLTVLFGMWFRSMTSETRETLAHWIALLGKWSMLDVFVVAITIVITKISHFASAQPRVGIYLFTTSVLLTLIISERVEKIIKK